MKLAVLKMATIAAAVMLAGCAQFRQHKGVVLDPQVASAIQPGVDNKASVEKALGRPTFTGQFNQNDWYYVSQEARTIAFKSQKVEDQEVLHITFDAAGNVASVNRTDETLIASIDPNKDKTPTLGRKRGFFDELFGNMGAVGAPLPMQQ